MLQITAAVLLLVVLVAGLPAFADVPRRSEMRQLFLTLHPDCRQSCVGAVRKLVEWKKERPDFRTFVGVAGLPPVGTRSTPWYVKEAANNNLSIRFLGPKPNSGRYPTFAMSIGNERVERSGLDADLELMLKTLERKIARVATGKETENARRLRNVR